MAVTLEDKTVEVLDNLSDTGVNIVVSFVPKSLDLALSVNGDLHTFSTEEALREYVEKEVEKHDKS